MDAVPVVGVKSVPVVGVGPVPVPVVGVPVVSEPPVPVVGVGVLAPSSPGVDPVGVVPALAAVVGAAVKDLSKVLVFVTSPFKNCWVQLKTQQ